MTALRTIVGVCDKYVKALKMKLIGKRDERRRLRRRCCNSRDGQRLRPDRRGYGNCCYDNEAVDNAINEFIDDKKSAVRRHAV